MNQISYFIPYFMALLLSLYFSINYNTPVYQVTSPFRLQQLLCLYQLQLK